MQDAYLDMLFNDDPEVLALLKQKEEKPIEPDQAVPLLKKDDFWADENLQKLDEEVSQLNRVDQEHKKKQGKKILNVLYNIVFFALCAGIVTGAVLFAFSSNPEKSIFGYRFYNVLSSSMEPSEGSPDGGFYEGDVIIVKKVTDYNEINVGDIITFNPGKESKAYLTHRVVDIKTQLNSDKGLYFVTRGDANKSDDPPISAELVIGKKVFTIPKLGGVVGFIQDNLILSIVFILSLFAFIVVLKQFLKITQKKKQANSIKI